MSANDTAAGRPHEHGRVDLRLAKIAEDAIQVALYDYHRSMVVDTVRVESFLRAIYNTVKPGDVVVDIGTGTGLLAMIAVAAGARKVYAIEEESIVNVARAIALANGVEERVEFIVGKSTEIELPETGDVLITETIGNAAFDEGILTWVADARSRLLKPDARLIPGRLTLMGSLLELPRDHAELERLASALYTFDLSPLRDLAVNKMAWDDLSPVSVVSEPRILIDADLHEAPVSVSGSCVLVARRDTTTHAVGVWFEALVADGLTLTNAPPNPAPSWQQGVIMLEKPLELIAGDEVRVMVDVFDDGATWKYLVERV